MFSAAVVAVWAVFLISLVTGGVEGGGQHLGPDTCGQTMMSSGRSPLMVRSLFSEPTCCGGAQSDGDILHNYGFERPET